MRRFTFTLSILLALTGILSAQSGVGGGGQSNVGGGGTSGGSTTTSSNLPQNTINVSGSPYNIQPGFQTYNCSTVSTQPTVTCTNFNFTSAMVGWLAHFTNCTTNAPCVGNIQTFPLNGGLENTIISVNGHIATLSSNANSSVTNGIFTFGPNNEAGWTLLETALNTLGTTPNCPGLWFPPGFAMSKKGHFNSITCQIKNLTPNDTQLTIMGSSQGGSFIEPTQDFDFTTCTGGVNSNTCFGGAPGIHWVMMGIDGGGDSMTGQTHAVNVLESRVDTLITGFYCTSWGSSATSMVGLVGNSGSQPSYSIQWDGCGSKPLYVKTGAGITHSFFQQTTVTPVLTVDSGAVFNSMFSFYGELASGNFTCVSGATQWSIAGGMNSHMDSMANCGGTSVVGAAVTGTLNAKFLVAAVGGTATSVAVNVTGTGKFSCDSCGLQAAGAAVNLSNTAKFISQGNNSINGTVASIGVQAATVQASIDYARDTLTGPNQAALVAANITPTSGFGTGCATAGQCVSVVTGNQLRGQFTMTYGTTPASPQTLTITFPTTFTAAPSCSLIDVGGTNAFPTSIVNNPIPTTTTATFVITNTPVGGSTDILQLNCGN